VSRGYGRSSRGLIMVHNGKRLLKDVDMVGDEPYLIGKVLNTVPIIVSENRIAGIQGLLDSCPVDIIILDDALQHRKVERNMDLVMISACDKPEDYHLLPWGKLREPLRNLKRAQYVIYTRTKRFLEPPQHKIINPYLKNNSTASIMQPVLMKMDYTVYNKTLPTYELVFAFCGIGNPDFFIQTVKDVGLNIVGKRIFQDHQKYNSVVLHNLLVQIESSKCRAVVTTEKDMVKIPESFMKKNIFYVIKIDVVFENDSDVYDLIKPILSQYP
jgi:tetraacyldisaccharide 4'-kinase